MSKKKIKGECCICGNIGDLTKEHVPPSKAYNDHKILQLNIDAQFQWKKKQSQDGSYHYSLCEPCNNNTGTWYGGEYVDFAHNCAQYAKRDNIGKIIEINLKLFPLKVVKQALSVLCSTSGHYIVKKNPYITKLILNKSLKWKPEEDNIRLYTHLKTEEHDYTVDNSTGIIKQYNIFKPEIDEDFTYFSGWPLGWSLTLNSEPDNKNGYDISHWFSFGYEECKEMTLNIPCGHERYYPFKPVMK